MNSKQIAIAVKKYIVTLATEEKLPMDLNELSLDGLISVIDNANLDEGEQLRIMKAGIILYEDETSLEDQIKLIEAATDEDQLIDDIEGVDVSQAAEYSYTVKSFLDSINY